MKATCEFVWNKKTYPAGCDVTGLDMEDQAALEAAGLIGTLPVQASSATGIGNQKPKVNKGKKKSLTPG